MIIIGKFIIYMKRINRLLITIMLLLIVVFIIIRNTKRYDYSIIKVQTLMNDSLKTGDPCLIVYYQIENNTDETIEVKETYNDDSFNNDMYYKKYKLLKHPALIINSDTLYGRHTWKCNVADVNHFVIKNDIYCDKIIISPYDILNLYKAKYSQTYSLVNFLKIVSLDAKLLYEYETFDKTPHLGEKRLRQNLIFSKCDLYGDESLFLDY